ncbi:hypothetical protein AKO1_010146 [Acrasis kona]|uniref:Uncharacterized protein n=1 Tax=Acrasis kona TaxID=1008807 RepID=A0AAW2ZR75_9EUKA
MFSYTAYNKKVRDQLDRDVENLISGTRSCVLLDYLDVVVEDLGKCTNDCIRLLTIKILERNMHYLFNKNTFPSGLNCEEITFINVDPSLEHPLIVEDPQVLLKLQTTLKNIKNNVFASSFKQFHTTVSINEIIDVCMLNGWILSYPYVYVRFLTFFDNCLCFEPLFLIKIQHNKNVITQYTIPACCCPNIDDVLIKIKERYQTKVEVIKSVVRQNIQL